MPSIAMNGGTWHPRDIVGVIRLPVHSHRGGQIHLIRRHNELFWYGAINYAR
jgi:hypothetical protein